MKGNNPKGRAVISGLVALPTVLFLIFPYFPNLLQ
jgi:hypothetical protein